MRNTTLTFIGKIASQAIQRLNLGNGSTWPGQIALKLNKHYINELLRDSSVRIILIAGTNGKTTTSLMLRAILEENGKRVIHNDSGANLLNGIASTLLLHTNNRGRIDADYAIFEVDENALPLILREMTPDYILLLNLFRDQLDRYGEVDSIAEKWKTALQILPEKTIIVANADDPKIAYLGSFKKNTVYFGLPRKYAISAHENHAVDSIYCPRCGNKLSYTAVFYSHLGDWRCLHCGLQHPDIKASKDIKLSLSGTYNLSNAHGIIALTHKLSTPDHVTAKVLKTFSPAFGRQEKIHYQGKNLQLFLSKNPTGFTESLRTIHELGGKHLLLVLNDRIADGRDVSWIWDIDMEPFLPSFTDITVSGDRAYDMGLRLKYADVAGQDTAEKQHTPPPFVIIEDLQEAIHTALQKLPEKETLYVLPTYTAMLAVRKITKGKKIL